jgi:hypothetical protein
MKMDKLIHSLCRPTPRPILAICPITTLIARIQDDTFPARLFRRAGCVSAQQGSVQDVEFIEKRLDSSTPNDLI